MMRRHQSFGSRSQSHKSLQVRGGAVHTFGTLLIPLAMGLVGLGFYLLGNAVAEPRPSSSATVLVASILLALGFVLLSYLLRTAMASHYRPRPRRLRMTASREQGTVPAKPPALSNTELPQGYPSRQL